VAVVPHDRPTVAEGHGQPAEGLDAGERPRAVLVASAGRWPHGCGGRRGSGHQGPLVAVLKQRRSWGGFSSDSRGFSHCTAPAAVGHCNTEKKTVALIPEENMIL
jgi:hypothetical protein